MKKIFAFLILVTAALILIPVLAEANSGDFAGGVAIGTGYAGVNTASTNGLIVQGNVGIGTTSPLYPLHIESSAFAGIELNNIAGRFSSFDIFHASTPVGTLNYDNNDGFLTLNASAGATNGLVLSASATSAPILFVTGTGSGSERMRITADGNIGIGTTNPAYRLDVQGTASGDWTENVSDSGNNAGIFINNTSGRFSAIEFWNSGSDVGTLNYDDNDGYFTLGSKTAATSGMALGSYSTTAPVIFFSNSSEKMRITASGNVGIGTPTPRGGSMLDVNGEIYVASFASGSSTTVCQNGNVLSSCTSALRFKQNVEPAHFGLNEVLQMKPVTFDQRNHKDNWEKHDFGFVAEEMEKINPLFVTYDSGGTLNGVRYMQLTAVNTKAIQEMQAEIDDLKQTIKELKHQQ